MRSSERGFSLVELLVTIAILSIIAALVLVAVDPATRLGQYQVEFIPALWEKGF